jgi:transposase
VAYSKDFRLKVLAAIDRGETEASVARRFDISQRTVGRFKALRRRTGDVCPDKTGPQGPVKLTPADDRTMHEQVQRKPGITAAELQPLLTVDVAISTICRRLIKLGLSLKKSR